MNETPEGQPSTRRKGEGPEGTFDARMAAEKLLDQFELAWKRGEAPELPKFLAMGEHLGKYYAQELHRIDSDYRAGSERDVNREILFGLLAAQLHFATPSAVLDAVRDWLRDRRDSVGAILARKKVLNPEHRQLLEALTREQIKNNWGDVVQSIADLSSVTQLLADLQSIQAVELKESLDTITIARESARSDKSEKWSAGGKTSRFRIIKFEAKGGLGQVYLARDEELGREVALKEIQPDKADDDGNRSRFVVEAEITGGLEHPGIVPVYGLGFYGDGRPYYAMRFIRGNNLTSAIERYHDQKRVVTAEEKTLEFRQLIGRFVDVCQAIEYAHSRGVLHRDLKPGNIMLGKYGETLVVDWGLAKVAGRKDQPTSSAELTLSPASASGSAPTIYGSAIGTPQYMSPEQAAGSLHELGPATDVYSLGATLYHLLTGSPPFGRRSVEAILELVRTGQWPPVLKVNPQLPPALAAICEKAMSLHQADRYLSVNLLAQDVEKWLADEPVAAYLEPVLVRTRRWIKRHQTTVGIVSSAVLLLLVGAIFFSIFAADRNRRLEDLNAKLQDSIRQETQARKEADTRRERAELRRRFDLSLATEKVWNESTFTKLNTSLGAIRDLSQRAPIESSYFDDNRAKFQDKFEAEMRRLAGAPHFDEATESQYSQMLIAFDGFQLPESKRMLDDLKELRRRRAADWNQVISGQGDALEIRGPNTQLAAFNRAIEGDFTAEVEFGPNWQNAKFIGVSLASEKEQQPGDYKFLVMAPGITERDLDDAKRLATKAEPIESALRTPPHPLTLVIMRGGQTLSSTTAFVPTGPLILNLTREGSKVTMRVNPNAPNLEVRVLRCDDPFAPGRFREVVRPYLLGEQSAQLTRLRTKRFPAEPSLVEQGDALFQKAQFQAAHDKYAAGLPAPEAEYKLALAELKLLNNDSAMRRLRKLVDSGDASADMQRWRRFAQVKLLSEMVQAGDPTWEEVRKILERMKRDGDTAEMLRMLPKSDRENILGEMGKMGLRFRIAFNTDDDLSTLEVKRELDDLFVEDKSVRVSTGWRIADAYRYAGKLEKAEGELRRTLQLAKGDTTVERQLVADLTWFLTADVGSTRDPQGRLIVNPAKANEAIELLNHYLDEKNGEQFAQFFPLLGERARIKYLLGQRKEAREDLKRMFDQLRTQPKSILYSEFAQAKHVSAFLFEDEGNKEEARMERRLATVKYWPGESLKPLSARPSSAESIDVTFRLALNGLALAFNGEAEKWEVEYLAKGHFQGSGISNAFIGPLIRNLFESPTARYGKLTAPELVRRLILELYSSKRGEPIGREMALKECGLAVYQQRPTRLILYEAVRLSSFDGQEIPTDLEPIAWDGCQQIIDCFNHKTIVEGDLPTILNLWTGIFTPKTWGDLKEKLNSGAEGFVAPKGLAESVAYVLAKNYLASGNEKNREPARELMTYAKTSPNSPPPIAAAATEDLKTLPPIPAPAN